MPEERRARQDGGARITEMVISLAFILTSIGMLLLKIGRIPGIIVNSNRNKRGKKR